MNASANRQLTERMMQDRDQLRGYLNLILISRCLERVADHATNIAEDAVYAAARRTSGIKPDDNPFPLIRPVNQSSSIATGWLPIISIETSLVIDRRSLT